jgi:hypothetical protein
VVTTAIALLAGIGLLVVASTQARFDRMLSAAMQPRATPRSSPATHSERVFMRVCRLLVLGVGVVCVAVGVLGIWSHT